MALLMSSSPIAASTSFAKYGLMDGFIPLQVYMQIALGSSSMSTHFRDESARRRKRSLDPSKACPRTLLVIC